MVELEHLTAFLKSTDLSNYDKMKERFFGEQSRFLAPGSLAGCGGLADSVVYATYPRSGNSLMRKYFETITGIATGSDMAMKHTPNVAL